LIVKKGNTLFNFTTTPCPSF